MVSTVESDDSGNLKSVSKVQLVDPNEEFKDLKYTDFSLTNLALSGSISGLTRIAPLQPSKLDSADNLNSQIGTMQSVLDSLQTKSDNIVTPADPVQPSNLE